MTQSEPTQIYQFGDYRIDNAEETLHKNGEKLSINHRTFQVLRLLVERAGKVVSKQEFFDTVWADTFVEDNSLTVTMTTLRKLLGDDPKQPKFIENLPRKGYRFIGNVVPFEDEPPTAPAVERRRTAVPPSENEVGFKSRKILIGALGIFLFLLIVGLGFKYSSSGVFSPRPAQIDSIAVLPFENLNHETEYLSDGLTESVINDLAELQNLRVISRNSVFEYKNKNINPKQISSDLNVHTLLTGRMVQRGDNLVVSAELTDTQADKQIWGHQYAGTSRDMFVFEQQLSRDISKVLGKLSTRSGPTDSPEAYQLYLKGRFNFNRRDYEGYQKAYEFYNQALEKDPTYALAYVGLAEDYSMGSFEFIKTEQDSIRFINGAANKALEIDPNMGEAYAVLGLNESFYEWNWNRAEADYKKAIELSPNYSSAHHWYAEFLAMEGRSDESQSEYDIALTLDPLSLPIQNDKGIAYFYARQFDKSIEYLERVRAMNPNYTRTNLFLRYAYRMTGKFEEAIQALQIQDSVGAEDRAKGGVAPVDVPARITLLRNGLKDGRKGFWRAVLRLDMGYGDGNSDPPDNVILAEDYAQLGEKDTAFAELEKAYERHIGSLCYIKARPELDPLHDDPRFADLVRRVGLPQ